MDLSTLNECQKAAVIDTEGAVLVFAGAGSGKTRVLTHRVAYLVEQGINPWKILAITFTNKATLEMKERLATMLGQYNDIWISTFHSFCANILRRHADKIGYNSNFSIFNESAKERTVKKVLREKGMEEKPYKDKIRFHISTAKNLGLAPDAYYEHIRLETREATTIYECYDRYEDILKASNAMDFDDLLIKTIVLFRGNEDVLNYYQNRFEYVHIDEFQDTNEVQLELAKLISGHHGNIFVVGDDDQSIYGWRGANVQNILDFGNIFKNVKIHKLMENYRSTQSILDAANNVICNNTDRTDKKLFTSCAKGVKVEYKIGYNDYQEAEWVLDNIRNLKFHTGYKNSDFAILVRTNSLTRLFEAKLRDAGISYRVYGGFKFFDRKEVQDVLAYMRALTNPLDNEAITRIINFPKRGIGDSSVETFETYCRDKGISLFDGILEINTLEGLTNSVKNKINLFREIFSDLISAKQSLPLYEFAKYLVEKLELEKTYKASGKEEDLNRWDNTVELVTEIKEYTKEKPEATVEEFLQRVILDSGVEVEEEDKLTISTMHSVKGLEFKTVFIVGCEEGIFPSHMAMNEENGIEEERRVMYVAITRARERLYISCAQNRSRYGNAQSFIPSRFLYEAMGDTSEQDQKKEMARNRNTDSIGFGNSYASSPNRTSFTPQKPVIQLQKVKVYNKDTDGFQAGAKVKHKKYGVGTIIVVDGDGASKNATITFKELGIKKFTLANAPITLE